MPEQTPSPAFPAGEMDADELGVVVATQAEDDNPVSRAGELADPPVDTGRPEGVAP